MSRRMFVRPHEDGTILEVFAQPGSAKDAIVGEHGGALKVKVRAPPVGGRANVAVEELLSAALGVPRGRVTVVSGHGSRRKRVTVAGMGPDEVSAAFLHVLTSRPHEPGQEAHNQVQSRRTEARGQEDQRQKEDR
ncbi:MAG: DUF167 domain-containing protein [Actinomycetota bacterium]